MRKIFTFLLSVMFVSSLFAQKMEATIPKASVAPEIGGDIDEVWSEADENAILLPFKTETPTLGNDGDTWWKGLWMGDGIYILTNVTDNDYYPLYAAPSGSTSYMYDQTELYFDVNYTKEDGVGARPTGQAGHYQMAPTPTEGSDNGTMLETFQPGSGMKYAYNADDAPNWFQEFFIPWTWLKDENGAQVDISADIGFDITVIDGDRPNDNARQRAVWANDGLSYGLDESWNNMDGAGLIYLEGAEVIYMEELTLTGGDITVNGETLQIGIEIYPEETTDKTLKWIVSDESTAQAIISADGLVTPLTNGTLIVMATSSDEYTESNEITINISNQKITVEKMNFLVDGNFDNPQANGRPNAAWSNAGTGTGYGTHTAWVEDGVFHFSPDSVLANQWDMKVRQRVSTERMAAHADERFLIGFKMWSSEETTFQLVLEQNSSWAHWGNNGASQTENAVPAGGGNQSRWDITPTPEPAWFKMSFVADNLDGNGPDFCFQPGKIGAVDIYMDSLYLILASDSSIIDWDYVTGVAQNRQLETLNVYPNPATDVVNVTLSKGNTNVAIYNSVGIKMEEIYVEGTHHVFNVGNYSSGLYFVKANNTVVKFVK
jgi:hypothetical protein